MERLNLLKGHLIASFTDGGKVWQTKDNTYKDNRTKLDWFKSIGWGFKDTEFVLNTRMDQIGFTGSRYLFSGQMMPNFKEWAMEVAGIDMVLSSLPKKMFTPEAPVLNDEFLTELGDEYSRLSFDDKERIMHSHGHTVQEIWALRQGRLERVVDCVLYPLNSEHVEKVVKLAAKYNVVVIPYGGGTNVTKALQVSPDETRMIISLDMTRMNKILDIDRENMTATVQCGIIGADLEAELKREGFVCGHEPDSAEFSSLGGWISTNASGMKKNKYGNIDDILINYSIVTPIGTHKYSESNYQRVSQGPNIKFSIIGHEGNYGVITEAVIKIKPIPETTHYGSIVFPDMSTGVEFMHSIGKSGIWPASCRLIDNF